MTLKKWFKKAYGIDGLTWPKLLVIALFLILIQILSGFFQSVGAKISDYFFTKPPSPYAMDLNEKLVSFLFYQIETNPITILIALAIVLPFYHFVLKKWFLKIKFRVRQLKTGQNHIETTLKPVDEVIFHEDFTTSNNGWEGPYRRVNQKFKDATARRENGYFVFQALEQAWPQGYNGIFIDIRDGITEGNKYQVETSVKSGSANTTMKFQLSLHDTQGGHVATAPENSHYLLSESYVTIKLEWIASHTNALRIHLVCLPGTGKIIVKNVQVRKIASLN